MPLGPDEPNNLERLANEKQPGIAAEFYEFLRDNKKWWLMPILILIGAFGILVALASTGAAPFIYTMF
jgi:membrane-bound ClpP family serine protease